MIKVSSSFRVSGGDLVLVGSQLALVSGQAKLAQDVQLWVKEIYQGDRFHPLFGSVLESYIGQIIDAETAFFVEAEVLRVLQNYQAVQLRGVTANPDLYSDEELLDTINSIVATILYDQVQVAVNITSVAGTALLLKIGVSS